MTDKAACGEILRLIERGEIRLTTVRIDDRDQIKIEDDCVDDVDRALNPIGRFYRHNGMHAGTTRMVLDEWGRCARCVKLGCWKLDA